MTPLPSHPTAACPPPSHPTPAPSARPSRSSFVLLLLLTALTLGSLSLAGCGSAWRAPGVDALAAAERATLRLAGDRIGLAVVNIDNRRPGGASVNRFELAPGDHVVVANLINAASDPITLEFTAAPGGRYTLQSTFIDGTSQVFRWRAVIRDDITGQAVSTQAGKNLGPIRAQR